MLALSSRNHSLDFWFHRDNMISSKTRLADSLPPWRVPKGLEPLAVWIQLHESGGLTAKQLKKHFPQIRKKQLGLFVELLFTEGFIYKTPNGYLRTCTF
ncbi:MAG: hypothetical protein QXR53_03610 [Candidatus Norongarragalinales archaeon]